MLYGKELEALSKMPMKDMAQHKGRSVEIYQSADSKVTGQYFTPERHPASFELVAFGYDNGKHQFYLKYPDCDFYVEITGGFGSSRGSMSSGGGRDILAEIIHPREYEGKNQMEYVTILKHDNQALIQFGYHQGDFNFLHRVAAENLSPHENKGIAFDKIHQDAILKQAFSRKFVAIPDLRRIEYAFMTDDYNFIVVDSSSHNYSYEDMNLHYGNLGTGMRRGEILNLQRYRDGGTTTFDAIVDGETFEFFSPTPFDQKAIPTWNNKPIEKVDADQLAVLVASLEIPLERVVEPLTR